MLSLTKTGVSVIILIVFTSDGSAAGYDDPSKKFFTFDDEETTENDILLDEKIVPPLQDKIRPLLDTCLREKNSLCSSLKILLRLIRDNANHDADEQTLSFDLNVNRYQLAEINNWLDSPKCLLNGFPAIVTGFHPRPLWKQIFYDKFSRFLDQNQLIISVTVVSLLIFLLLVWWVHVSKSWISAGTKLFALGFVISVVITYCRKYEEAHSKQYWKIISGLPAECRKHELRWYETLYYTIKGFNSIMPDACEEYFRVQLMTPMLQFTIVEAFTETATRMIMTTVPVIFEYAGEALIRLFRILPWYLWFPIGIGIPLFLFCVYLVHKNYRFSNFFGVIEPSRPSPVPSLTNNTGTLVQDDGSSRSPVISINAGGDALSLTMSQGNVTIRTASLNSTRDRIEELSPEDVTLPGALSLTSDQNSGTLSCDISNAEENSSMSLNSSTLRKSSIPLDCQQMEGKEVTFEDDDIAVTDIASGSGDGVRERLKCTSR